MTNTNTNPNPVGWFEIGTGGFIDTVCPTTPCATSAFIIPYKSKAFFERVTLTNTLGSAGGRQGGRRHAGASPAPRRIPRRTTGTTWGLARGRGVCDNHPPS